MATTASPSVAARGRTLFACWRDLLTRHQILTYSSSIAFQALAALFPLLLLGLFILGATGHETVWTTDIAPVVQKRVTPPVYNGIDFTARLVFASAGAGVIAFASLLSVWEVSRSVRACMTGMNAIYETEETRPAWLRLALSLVLAGAIIACLLGAVVLLTFVKGAGGAGHWPVVVARWTAAVGLLGLAVGLLFRYAPAHARETRWESVGAAVVVGVWLGASILFKWYMTSLADFTTATGSLTVFVALTTYFYVSATIFLLGVQLDELLREDAAGGGRGVLDVVLRRR